MCQTASLEAADLECVSNSHLQGTVQITDSDYLLFTIPYERDWKIRIDGKEAEQVEVFDALMAVPVTEGTHTIELRYVPQGFIVGAVISLAAFMICILLLFLQKKDKEKLEQDKKAEGKKTEL